MEHKANKITTLARHLAAVIFNPPGRSVLIPVLSVILSLGLCFGLVVLTGGNAPEVVRRLLRDSLGNWEAIADTLQRAGLLVLTGLAVGVSFRAGLFNIGAEGQFMVGALAASFLGWWLKLPSWLHVPVVLLGSCLAGALYAAIAGVLKALRGVHEVISTIMLNWIAYHLIINCIIEAVFSAARISGMQTTASSTPEIQPTARLWRPLGKSSTLDIGILIVIVTTMLLAFLLRRSRFGYELKVLGMSPEAARYGGVNLRLRITQVMSLSGALAGMAGAIYVLGMTYSFPSAFTGKYGFDGIVVALIAGNNPWGILVVGLFFGALKAGTGGLEPAGVPVSFADIVLGVAVLMVAAYTVWDKILPHIRTARKLGAASDA